MNLNIRRHPFHIFFDWLKFQLYCFECVFPWISHLRLYFIPLFVVVYAHTKKMFKNDIPNIIIKNNLNILNTLNYTYIVCVLFIDYYLLRGNGLNNEPNMQTSREKKMRWKLCPIDGEPFHKMSLPIIPGNGALMVSSLNGVVC